VPAVCPYCACRPLAGPCGSTLFVFIGTVCPFIEMDESSTLSGADLRGLARDAVIFPNTFVPAVNRTRPLSETSCASFASKLLPTMLCDVIRLTVFIVRLVPAGIVAALEREIANKAQKLTVKAMSCFEVI
jgi:hypothetical protein